MNDITEVKRVIGALRIRAMIAEDEGEYTFAELLTEAADTIEWLWLEYEKTAP